MQYDASIATDRATDHEGEIGARVLIALVYGLGLAVTLSVALGTLYLLVRFVKWAWEG